MDCEVSSIGDKMAIFDFTKLEIDGAFLIDTFSVGDKRGGFTKCFEKNFYSEGGIEFNLNETFFSSSSKNVIRGLHFQTNNPQAKLVTVISGKIWDVIVDLRKDSPTYKKWIAKELSADNHKALFIPRGCAHGFVALDDDTVMLYQCDGAYDKDSDTGIIYNDPDIGIIWPIDDKVSIHSDRDLSLMSFREFEERFRM